MACCHQSAPCLGRATFYRDFTFKSSTVSVPMESFSTQGSRTRSHRTKENNGAHSTPCADSSSAAGMRRPQVDLYTDATDTISASANGSRL